MNNLPSYNRGYFEGNFDLPMMKKRIGNEKRTPRKMAEKGGGVGLSIDQSGYEYHKNSEVSPGNRQTRQKNSEFWPILRIIPAKSAA
jgi:hypothetical protein